MVSLMNAQQNNAKFKTPKIWFRFQIAEAETLSDLRDAMISSWQFLELAGCNRLVNRLEEKEEVVEDLVSFTLITRMQLPLQR